MGGRAEQLANQFTNANAELIGLLERASPEQWRQRTLDEGEPTMTTAEVIEQRQIAHVRAHLASIRTVFGG